MLKNHNMNIWFRSEDKLPLVITNDAVPLASGVLAYDSFDQFREGARAPTQVESILAPNPILLFVCDISDSIELQSFVLQWMLNYSPFMG